jgi:hypothetical protein
VEDQQGLHPQVALDELVHEVRLAGPSLPLDDEESAVEVVVQLLQQAFDHGGLVLPPDELAVHEIGHLEELDEPRLGGVEHGRRALDALERDVLRGLVRNEVNPGPAKRQRSEEHEG